MPQLRPTREPQPADYWPQTEPLSGPAVGSLVLHVAAAAGVLAFAFAYHHLHAHQWGSENAGGTIQATIVSALPLPHQTAPNDEVLATDNPSEAPAPPEPKAIPKPQDNAVPIATKTAPKPDTHRQTQSKEKQAPTPKASFGERAAGNIPRSTTGQMGNPNQPVSVGGDFGSRFAYYINIIRINVDRNWYRQEVDTRTNDGSQVLVTFNIARNGSISGVRILTASGSPTLNQSAIHAVQRVDSLPPLPNAYQGSSIDVEYTFNYQRAH